MSEKLKVEQVDGVLEIIANREGLRGLADVCLQLAALPEDDGEARKLGNHYHYSEFMNNAAKGSLDMAIMFGAGILMLEGFRHRGHASSKSAG